MFNLAYLRSFRFYDFATFDLTVSFLGVLILAPLLTRFFHLFKLDIPTSSWLYFTLPIGVIMHIVIGQQTLMVKYLLDPTGHYWLKLILIVLTILGIRGITLIK